MNEVSARPLDPRAQRSRQRLHEAMLALVAKKRLDDISITEIVAQAEIGYATFFRHYPDKQSLWNAVTASLLHEINLRVSALIASDDHHAAAIEICRFVDQHKDVYRVMLAGGAANHTRDAMLSDSLAVASSSQDAASIDLPPTLGSHFAVGAIFAILAWWLEGHDDIEPEQIGAYLDRLVFTPLFDL